MNLKVIIYATNKLRILRVTNMLMQAGINDIIISKSPIAAAIYQKKYRIKCVIFERNLIYKYEKFFNLFIDSDVLFVPMSVVSDANDIIDAINTSRTAYYLIDPIHLKHAVKIVDCLQWRLKPKNRERQSQIDDATEYQTLSADLNRADVTK